MDKWLKQYKENYEGKSAEAKAVADYVNQTFNGANYIPWATMERLVYMQDPNAKFEKIRNEKGGLVHTDSMINENLVENKDGIVSKTSALVVSHFVKVSLVFLGKEFIEEYPIQDQDYSAAKIYNQNLVNRALQRAIAKVASRATGIGLRFYESKELQFEEVKEEEKKPVVKKTTKKTEEVKEEKKPEETKVVEPAAVIEVDGHQAIGFPIPATEEPKAIEEPKPVETTQETNFPKEVVDLCKLIKTADKDKMSKVLQSLNTPILKQHGFTLSLEDSDEVLCEKLTHFQDVTVFTRAITTMLG